MTRPDLTPDALARVLLAPQPAPVHSAMSRSVTDSLLVVTTDPVLKALLTQRREQGRANPEYGGLELKSHDGRDRLAESTQEAIDLWLYLHGLWMETGNPVARYWSDEVRNVVAWLAGTRRMQP